MFNNWHGLINNMEFYQGEITGWRESPGQTKDKFMSNLICNVFNFSFFFWRAIYNNKNVLNI